MPFLETDAGDDGGTGHERCVFLGCLSLHCLTVDYIKGYADPRTVRVSRSGTVKRDDSLHPTIITKTRRPVQGCRCVFF